MLITDPVGCPHSYINKERFISCVFAQEGWGMEDNQSDYFISYYLVAKAGNVIKYVSRDIDVDLGNHRAGNIPRLIKASQSR